MGRANIRHITGVNMKYRLLDDDDDEEDDNGVDVPKEQHE